MHMILKSIVHQQNFTVADADWFEQSTCGPAAAAQRSCELIAAVRSGADQQTRQA
jgi:hypothetical protein